eukprot:292732_1
MSSVDLEAAENRVSVAEAWATSAVQAAASAAQVLETAKTQVSASKMELNDAKEHLKRATESTNDSNSRAARIKVEDDDEDTVVLDETMKVRVRTFSGWFVQAGCYKTLDIEPSNTIEEVKSKIAAHYLAG